MDLRLTPHNLAEAVTITQYNPASSKLPIVLIHGWNTTGFASWGTFVNTLENTVENRIILIPLPGMGSCPAPKTIWGAEEYSEYVVSVLQELGISTCMLVGHSFGGCVASIVASNHPQLVSHLILLAPAIVRKPYLETTKQKVMKALLHPRILKTTRQLWRWVRSSADYRKNKGIMKDIFERVLHEDMTRYLPAIMCTVDIFWGTEDTYTPISQLATIRSLLPTATIHVLPGVNHGVHMYAINEVVGCIKHGVVS
jgi:pimeloyl-ACP methyl ester carboxylesterase